MNTIITPPNASSPPSRRFVRRQHLRNDHPSFTTFYAKCLHSNTKAPQTFQSEALCLFSFRQEINYSMTFGKVSTFASDTHWVTAASYAAS